MSCSEAGVNSYIYSPPSFDLHFTFVTPIHLRVDIDCSSGILTLHTKSSVRATPYDIYPLGLLNLALIMFVIEYVNRLTT